MLIDSGIVTRGSGSLGGLTLSRNRGGMYFRARAQPVNPNTPFQQRVRSAMALLSARWSSVLTKAELDAWDLYALNVPLPGPLGDLRNVGGLGMYQRTNVCRLNTLEAELTVVDDAPGNFNLGEYTAPTIAGVSEVGQTAPVAFEVTDDWTAEVGSALLVYISRPTNASINYFKGPFRLAGAILGADPIPPTSPEPLDLPFPVLTGQQIFWQARVSRIDGRLSALSTGRLVVT